MIDYTQLLLLGAIAGFTIFIGLPLAAIKNVSSRAKGFLNALSLGILVFLIIDIFSHAWESTEDIASDAFVGNIAMSDGILHLVALFGGIAIGLFGLAWYEHEATIKRVPQILSLENIKKGDDHLHQVFNETNGYRLAMMIAVGIGFHNLAEGLSIGQSYVAGEVGLALLLIMGFATHNATEGFGIASPMTGLSKKPTIRFMILLGLIGGGPTFIGTLLGSLWFSSITYILSLSIAGGALIYVSMLMYNSGRKHTSNSVIMIGIFVGLVLGFGTDLIIHLGEL
ncbi:MAG TPA: ZIP family metal transporter [Nitrosarchaeum sp.]|jgi:ZIP family zinc transporter|nr:ZIP family metal transporter [Nitrosarchaeum sp.]